MMQTTYFSSNWNNKLGNLAFSTLRVRNDRNFKLDQVHEIAMKGMVSFPARVVQVKHVLLDNLSDGMCYLDTGYSKDETIRLIRSMFPKVDFRHIQLSWIVYKRLTAEEVSEQMQMFRR